MAAAAMSGWARSGVFDGLNIAVLGAGAWGTALAISLAQKHAVTLWARDRAQAEGISASRTNARYLPGALLPDSVAVTHELAPVQSGAELAIIATPVVA